MEALADWSQHQKKDFKKIAKVIERVGQAHRVRDEKHVKKSRNPKHENVYEIRADKGHARLMFFYDDDAETAVFVCTNPCWKGSGNQDQAFETCNQMKLAYEKQKLEEAKHEKNVFTQVASK
ncbi:MAG: type II toxin-antitoxin system RelE/ParE family toxin [Opitutales bacterium]